MASLLERMDIAPGEGGTGPIRNRGGRAASLPYSRPHKLGQSKADADTVWKHDLYSGPGKDLGSRLTESSSSPTTGTGSAHAPKVNSSGAAAALRQAIGLQSPRNAHSSSGALNIKGASNIGSNVVEVTGLVAGTSPADVETIFKRCGTILEATDASARNASDESVTVRLKFKSAEEAKAAVTNFDGVSADGRVLKVRVVGISSASLGGRIGISGGVGADVLMDDPDAFGGSKMRSDNLLNEPGAVVLTAPPGTKPSDSDAWRGSRGGRGRRGGGRGGRRGGRGGRRGGGGMDID